jgi:DNA primase catalytic subunit
MGVLIKSLPINSQSKHLYRHRKYLISKLSRHSSPSYLFFRSLKATENDPVMLLRTFYNRFFPYKLYYQWLNYEIAQSTKNFTHREFSFTLASDTYLRYNSFGDVEEFRKELERLQPVKIDIGAVYNAKPKDKKTINAKTFQPVEKELVFDIDMTDYDEIRTCCSYVLRSAISISHSAIFSN